MFCIGLLSGADITDTFQAVLQRASRQLQFVQTTETASWFVSIWIDKVYFISLIFTTATKKLYFVVL
jgi:hypothetical protein